VLVSILIPCFNAERWLAGAVESALSQTWPDKEVIVVDDGSTDGSAAIAQRFGSRIRFEVQAHAGANVARNRLLELAQGKWVQYLDADDYLLRDKVESQARFLGTARDVDVVYGPATLELWSGEAVDRSLTPIPEPRDPWLLLVRWQLPQTGAPLWRKQAILDAGGWTPDQPCAQEHELYLRLLMHQKRFVYHPTNGAVYRYWTTATISRRNSAETRRRRLEVLHRAEEHLRTTGALTPERAAAINATRFGDARMAWAENRDEAHAILASIARSDATFTPRGPAAPPRYRMLYQLLGFDGAERVAALFRARSRA
jgi:glycosyltransferase involved in cell wall biosynthesis